MHISDCINVEMRDELYIGNAISGSYVGPGMTLIDPNTNLQISNHTY